MKLFLFFILLVVLASIFAVVKKNYFPNPSTALEISFWVIETLIVAVIIILYMRKNNLKIKD